MPVFFAADLDKNLDREDEECRSLLRAWRRELPLCSALMTARELWAPLVYRLADFYDLTWLGLENGNILLTRISGKWHEPEEWLEMHENKFRALREFRENFFSRVEIVEEISLPGVNVENTLKMVKLPDNPVPVRMVEKSRILQFHFNSGEEQKVVLRELEKLAKEVNVNIPFGLDRGVVYCQVLTKGDALTFLSKYGNGSSGYKIAIGDALNDLPMLKISDFPCCPADSLDEVKKEIKKMNGFLSDKNGVEAVKESINRAKLAANF